MSKRGSEFLRTIYGVLPEKIDLIPHGIPDVPFVDPSFHKDLFGVEGKIVLLSFGLLSPNKGIEDVIAALPAIADRCPNVVYIILGATHPHVLLHEGETYRLSLQWMAQEKGMESRVIFYNRFVSLEELIEFISAADIYITPYLNEAQITSGTLAYTLGAGKAVVSTPYWYAEEMLADERGVLVPFHNPAAMAAGIIDLLENEAKRHAMRKRAYMFGRDMIWPHIARRYMESFERAKSERRHYILSGFTVKALDERPVELPPLKLDHLRHMTDETGILQHAIFTIPNYSEGYTTDDNARALLISPLLEELGSEESFELASRYLAFVWYAFNAEDPSLPEFFGIQSLYGWKKMDQTTVMDARSGRFGYGTWVDRTTIALHNMAGWMFEQALPSILDTTSPRAWAFALIGICEYLRRFAGDRMASQVREELAGRLLALYKSNRSNEWRWYEEGLSYCNAAIPHAMLICGQLMANKSMFDAGLESLSWLADLQRADGEGRHFVPIGSNGFYGRGGERARFDQQPVEAQAMVSACLEAYRIIGDKRWRREARCAFDWFIGRNDLNLPIYDPETGGCRDGLHPDRQNENQGAESTLAFLQALLELRIHENTLLMEA